MIQAYFSKQKKKFLGKLTINYNKLKGKTFYTDVETFNHVLDRIFYGINLHNHHKEVKVEAIEDVDGTYLDIKITHVDSLSSKNSKTMLAEVEDGDFASIKKSLTNLCDWSIENSYENEHYRINYLRSDMTINEIEVLKEKPLGFTHILRFYYHKGFTSK